MNWLIFQYLGKLTLLLFMLSIYSWGSHYYEHLKLVWEDARYWSHLITSEVPWSECVRKCLGGIKWEELDLFCPRAANRDYLRDLVLDIWEDIVQEPGFFHNVVESIPLRLKAINKRRNWLIYRHINIEPKLLKPETWNLECRFLLWCT